MGNFFYITQNTPKFAQSAVQLSKGNCKATIRAGKHKKSCVIKVNTKLAAGQLSG